MHKAFALVCLCHLTFYNDLFGFQDLAHFFILLCLWSNRLKLLMACSITRVLITMSPAVFGMRRILCRYMYCTCCVNLMQGGMLIRYNACLELSPFNLNIPLPVWHSYTNCVW